jgi:hypothetical protein
VIGRKRLDALSEAVNKVFGFPGRGLAGLHETENVLDAVMGFAHQQSACILGRMTKSISAPPILSHMVDVFILQGSGARGRRIETAMPAHLFAASFLRCCPAPFYGHRDAQIFELFAGLQRSREPSRLQPASRPRFRWIVRIAIFRGNCAPRAASNSFAARSIGSKSI